MSSSLVEMTLKVISLRSAFGIELVEKSSDLITRCLLLTSFNFEDFSTAIRSSGDLRFKFMSSSSVDMTFFLSFLLAHFSFFIADLNFRCAEKYLILIILIAQKHELE